MAKKRKPEPDEQDLTKSPQTFRLTLETVRRLEQAARSYGMTKTAYTELALQERMKRDRIV